MASDEPPPRLEKPDPVYERRPYYMTPIHFELNRINDNFILDDGISEVLKKKNGWYLKNREL